MTERKREPLADLKPPKFMKPGDSPELDQALDRLRFDSDIYAPGEYDVFGRRRNLKGLRPSQREIPPWGAPPHELAEPTAPSEGADPIAQPERPGEPPAPPGTTDPTTAPEHADPAAPPVASPAARPKLGDPTSSRLRVAALAMFAALVIVTVVLAIVANRVNPKPSQTSASAPSASAVAAPTASAAPRATAAPEVSVPPPIGIPAPTTSATPTTSVAPPPAPSQSHAPTGRLKPRVAADDPYDAALPPPRATAAPVAPPPPPPPAPTATTPPELLTN
jgi:hypothetical protein